MIGVSILKDYFRHIPLGRGGMPDEVGNASAFLASDLASFITGADIRVDGGLLCRIAAPLPTN